MKYLDVIVNDERLLDFALSHVAEKDSGDVHPVAEEIITIYIINEFAKEGRESFTEEEIQERYAQLILDKVLVGLVESGLVDVDFSGDEPAYQVTQKGRIKIDGN
jgi:hypothetical protein